MESLTRNERRFIVVFDMSGWRLSHGLQLRKVHALVRTLQDHYPEMLEAAILLKVNRFFASAWRLIKPRIVVSRGFADGGFRTAQRPDDNVVDLGDDEFQREPGSQPGKPDSPWRDPRIGRE